MQIELGNHAAAGKGLDDRPKVTTMHFPEADEHGLGGYSHEIGGLEAAELKEHLVEAQATRNGITNLPGHEVLVSVTHLGDGSWRQHGREKPAWINVTDHDLTPEGRSEDVERVLCDFYGCPSAREYFNAEGDLLHLKKELAYWTPAGAPGQLPSALELPNASMLYTNNGRVISNVNDGGGQVGTIGVGITTGTTATALGVSGNPGAYTGYRIVVYSTSGNNLVWGNITATSASAITVDQWYNFATPGGAAGTTPTTPWAFAILDGGFTSTWFVGLATGANAPAATDTTLTTNGNVEVLAGTVSGMGRKIAPYAQTSGVASRSITLTPVYTAGGTGLPITVTTIGVFASMVVGTAGTMKFETALNASATLSAASDQLTVTETITGS